MKLMKLEAMHWLGIGINIFLIGGSIASSSFGLIETNLLYFLLVISFLVLSAPFLISFLLGQGRQKEREDKFLAFIRDLVEMVRSGTPISKSIINLRKRNYGSLTPHIAKLANQLSIGITLTDALQTFARDTNSRVIMRAVGLISQAERAGGNIEAILDSVAHSVNQIDELRKERKAAVSNLITQGYLIFIVFIIIMLVLEFKILPLVSGLNAGAGGDMSLETNTVAIKNFSMPLFVMLLVQSLFAGLVIGKIAEGTVRSGVKHSFALIALTLLIRTGASLLFPVPV